MIKVLVVDDEPQIRRALILNLGVRGYQVLEAATGVNALATVEAEHPDLVLLDLGLPDMDGMKVLAMLRQTSNLPVIVLTARDDEQSKHEALEAGADDYITKPFDMAELVRRIRATLPSDADMPPS